MVAHRTSPTNIGLYLLATACARATSAGSARASWSSGWRRRSATLDALPRHRGHFSTGTTRRRWRRCCRPTCRRSTAATCAATCSPSPQACLRAAPRAARRRTALRRALRASSARRRAAARRRAERLARRRRAGRAARRCADPLGRARRRRAGARAALVDAPAELDGAAAWRDRRRCRRRRSGSPGLLARPPRDAALGAARRSSRRRRRRAAARLRAIAARCQRAGAGSPTSRFLYDRKRRLFHIGYRVAEQQLDASYYDLLASEARADQPAGDRQGRRAGRATGPRSAGRSSPSATRAGLRSWSGSMFEYLMPSLVLDEPHGSVLHERRARGGARADRVRRASTHVPWGISESAYAGSDHTLAYQYAPQGVPRLALRRTPPDELVIAPYATALAAHGRAAPRGRQPAPRCEALGARGALRLHRGARLHAGAPVAAPTASRRVEHLHGPPPGHEPGRAAPTCCSTARRGAGAWRDPRIERGGVAAARARAARGAAAARAAGRAPAPTRCAARAPGMLRDVAAGHGGARADAPAVERPLRASSLRANGAGYSRWGGIGITRWRDDALRDALRQLLLPALGPPAAAGLAHPASGARPGGALPAAASTPTASCFDADLARAATPTTRSGSARKTTSNSASVELRNTRRAHARPRAAVGLRGDAGRRRAPTRRTRRSRTCSSGADWQAAHQALVLRAQAAAGRPSRAVLAAHFLADGRRRRSRRVRHAGRPRSAGSAATATPSQPLAAFDEPPRRRRRRRPAPLDTGLDPVARASRCACRSPPQAQGRG